jgi:glycosyltransferase involved in cell wall biosynthesis
VNADPFISVVIATKDRADFLAGALGSLLVQQHAPRFEAVVVDNGSRDATQEVIAKFAARGDLAVRSAYVAEPNRGAARNAGIALARGAIVLFADDDVIMPSGFLAAHTAAHAGTFPVAVSGPILNVPDAQSRPKPGPANYSRAFFCTCNVSVPRSALVAAGNFDERFNLYGWEDTELGLRLRRRDVRRVFAWDAYLWHIKPQHSETLEVVLEKVTQRAQMAARLLQKDDGWRTRLATGAYALNLARAAVLSPGWSLPFFTRLANDERQPAAVRAFARAQALDVAYTTTLRRALAQAAAPAPAAIR